MVYAKEPFAGPAQVLRPSLIQSPRREREQIGRDDNPERRNVEIDDELEFGWLHTGKLPGLSPLRMRPT